MPALVLRRKVGMWRTMVSCGATGLAVVGCAATSKTTRTQATPPAFDWTPPESVAPASAAVSFAVVSANFSEDEPWTHIWPFTDFSRNLGLDFQEALSARGFTVRGPFKTREEMTFPDKKASDLVLTPTLEVRLEIPRSSYEEHISVFTPNTYTLEGDAAVGGRVTLALTESISGERMWFKSIELPRTTVAWKGDKKYVVPPGTVDLSDPGIGRALGKSLEGFYATVMQTTWDYLNPEEMALVKTQSQDLKERFSVGVR